MTSYVDQFDFGEQVEDVTDVHIECGSDIPLSAPGPFSGVLIPGHLYRFGFNAGLGTGTSTIPTNSPATGSGRVSLVFTPVVDATVPSSSAWSLLAVMAALMVTGAWLAASTRRRLVVGRPG